MGCDIHLRAELRVGLPDISDADEVVTWLTDESLGSRQGATWLPAERLTPNPHYTPGNDEGEMEFEVERTDRFYYGRNYRLFARLSNVRNYDDNYGGRRVPLFEDRGLPDDLSEHVQTDFDIWEPDAHSMGYATLAELEQHDWTSDDEYSQFAGAIERLRQVAHEQGCDADSVRFVWWYDN